MAKPLPVPAPQLKAYIRAHHLTKTAVAMANEIGVVEGTIFRHAREIGVRVSSSHKGEISKEAEMQARVAFIRKHGASMTVREIAIALEEPSHKIYWAVRVHGLTIKIDKEKHPRRSAMEEGGMFNVHARENWMI
jgi:hypothetical protein